MYRGCRKSVDQTGGGVPSRFVTAVNIHVTRRRTAACQYIHDLPGGLHAPLAGYTARQEDTVRVVCALAGGYSREQVLLDFWREGVAKCVNDTILTLSVTKVFDLRLLRLHLLNFFSVNIHRSIPMIVAVGTVLGLRILFQR